MSDPKPWTCGDCDEKRPHYHSGPNLEFTAPTPPEALKEALEFSDGPVVADLTIRRHFKNLAAAYRRAQADSDAEMERVKACEHIAEGDEGWEKLRDLCPSTTAVSLLRDEYDKNKAKVAALEAEVKRVRSEDWEAQEKNIDTLEAERDQWRSQYKACTEVKDARTAEVAALKTERDNWKNNCDFAQIQVERLAGKVDGLKAERDAAIARGDKTSKVAATYKMERDVLKAEREDLLRPWVEAVKRYWISCGHTRWCAKQQADSRMGPCDCGEEQIRALLSTPTAVRTEVKALGRAEPGSPLPNLSACSPSASDSATPTALPASEKKP